MSTNRPDPGDFIELAQRMLRDLFGDARSDDEPWAEATRRGREHEPSSKEQRENLTFALATRAVEALEDLALNVAAIRQGLERRGQEAHGAPGDTEGRGPNGDDATGE